MYQQFKHVSYIFNYIFIFHFSGNIGVGRMEHWLLHQRFNLWTEMKLKETNGAQICNFMFSSMFCLQTCTCFAIRLQQISLVTGTYWSTGSVTTLMMASSFIHCTAVYGIHNNSWRNDRDKWMKLLYMYITCLVYWCHSNIPHTRAKGNLN
jgi:hypothetical protein